MVRFFLAWLSSAVVFLSLGGPALAEGLTTLPPDANYGVRPIGGESSEVVSVPTQGDIVEQTEATETIGKPDEKKRPNDSSKSGQSPTKNVLDKVEGQSCQDDSVANAAVAQDRLMSLAHELIRRKGSCKKGKACSHDHK